MTLERGRAWRVAFTRPGGQNGQVLTLDPPTTIIDALEARGFTAVTVTEMPIAIGIGDLAEFVARDPLQEAQDKARRALTADERQLLGLGF
jgi:hypothetical protein